MSHISRAVPAIPKLVCWFVRTYPGCTKNDIANEIARHYPMNKWEVSGLAWRSNQIKASLTSPDLINLGTERCHSWYHSDFFAKVC